MAGGELDRSVEQGATDSLSASGRGDGEAHDRADWPVVDLGDDLRSDDALEIVARPEADPADGSVAIERDEARRPRIGGIAELRLLRPRPRSTQRDHIHIGPGRGFDANEVHPDISLFSGALGLDIGLERTCRFESLAFEEYIPEFCDTIRRNREAGRIGPDATAVIEADIRELDPLELAASVGVKPRELTLLVGGPPCQAFSSAGRRQSVPKIRSEQSESAVRSGIAEWTPNLRAS